MWSLYVPIHVKSWPKVRLGKVEVDSNIAQNHFHSSQEVIYAHYLCKCIWQHARFRRYSPLSTQLPRSDICRSSNVKYQRSNEISYMTYYMRFMLTLVITCPIQAIQSLKNSISSIWPLTVIQCQRSWGKLKDHNIIWLIICVSYKLWSKEAQCRRNVPLKIDLPWFDL